MGTASRRRPTSLLPTLVVAGISTAAQDHPCSPDADDSESTPLLPRRRCGASVSQFPGATSRTATAQAAVLTQPPLQRAAARRAAPHQAAAAARTRRLRWHEMAFGSVRVPAAIDMDEIRRRLQAPRRDTEPEAAAAAWAPWRLIRSLSCKGVAVAAASAPVRLA